MPTERKPTAKETRDHSPLAAPLVALTRFCVRRPVSVLALGIGLSALGILISVYHLGFKTSRVDLINPDSAFNQLWLKYLDEFGDNDEMVVVVEGKNGTEVVPVLDALSERITAEPQFFRSVIHGVDISKIRAKGLHYVPPKDLATIDGFVKETQPIINGNWSRLGVGPLFENMAVRLHMKRQLAALPPGTTLPTSALPPEFQGIDLLKKIDATRSELDQLALSLEQSLLTAGGTYGSPWPMIQMQAGAMHRMPDVVAACSQGDTGYFVVPTKTGVLGFVMLQLAETEKGGFAHGSDAIDTLRGIVAEERTRFPGVEIGITGMVVIENDEMRGSSESMALATILSLIGVTAVFIAGLGGFRHPLMGVFAMLVSFGWIMGFVTLTIGHLNILSVAFGSILIGLGLDFGTHYVSRYLQVRQTVRSPGEAIVRAAGVIGPGVVTGAVTTAVAFFMAGLAEFVGIAELGIISGAGILCCCLGATLLVPAMIVLGDGNRPHRPLPDPLDVLGWIAPIFRFPKTVIALFMAVTLLLMFGVPRVWYDHNLLNLQADGEESVEWERKMIDMENGGQNACYALSIADTREQLLRRKAEFAERYPELRVDEIVSWFPEVDPERLPYINDIAAGLARLPERAPEIPVCDPESLGRTLQQLQMLLANEPDAGPTVRRLENIRNWLRSTGRAECAERLAKYQCAMTGDLLSRLNMLKSMSHPEPPTMSDLPESFLTRFVSKNGKHLMKIYTDADIWNMEEMERFVHQVRSIDANATGTPLQTYEASKQMQQGYITAAIYAFIAVFVLLFVDFRSLKETTLALAPMLLGLLQMFGILGLLDIPLNPANMIVLPLILGMGIDYGVHVIHDFRSHLAASPGKRYAMSPSTASAVLMTGLTTMIGFGALMIASHKGLQSLGRVLVIGITCCLFTSLILLPAVLAWWSEARGGKKEGESKGEETASENPVATALPVKIDGNEERRANEGPTPIAAAAREPETVEPEYPATIMLPVQHDTPTESGVRRLRRRTG